MGRFRKLEFDSQLQKPVEVRREPIGPDAYCLQAEREYREGNFDNALRYYSRALENDRLMIESWRRRVVVLVELGEYSEADLWADKALELFPDDQDLLAGKAVALCRCGRHAQAFSVADRAIRCPVPSPYPWIARGEILLAVKNAQHEYCFSKAVVVTRPGWHVFSQIGRAYQFYGHFSKAIEYFNRAVGVEPVLVFVLMEKAHCQFELGLNRQANSTLDEVLRISPKNVAARRLQASLEKAPAGGRVKGFFNRLLGR